MPAANAAKPEKVVDIAGVVNELKRKVQNISQNLDLGGFNVLDARGKVVKTIVPEKGLDAAYVINRSTIEEDILTSGDFLKEQRVSAVKSASDIEIAFAETQEDLIRAVDRWRAAVPGATKVSLAIETGRLQRELATLERRLRDAQYTYREVLPFSALRRLYSPLSNDDRVTTFDTYQLSQTLNLAKARVVPVSE